MDARGKKKSNKRRWLFLVLAVLMTAVMTLFGFAAYQISMENKRIEINEYVIKSERLTAAFDGYKIAQVSDLHNAEFGEDNERLLSKLQEADADIILLTGDIIDSRKTDVAVALRFVERVVKIAPTYYVKGNHEERVAKAYEQLKNGMISYGVTVLENQAVTIEKDGENIRLIGVKDPACVGEWDEDVEKSYVKTQLQQFAWGTETDYTVLLSHRPELFDLYAEMGVDLVFSGHAHGGQFRLPRIGGLFAPDQGFFPKYDGGLYEKGENGQTKMLVSRGLGNSLFPFRVNNPPEIVVAVLEKGV
jgi:predicted MPP superfamily phosphohydrolase